jgi:molybdopterin converting factor small subunit
MYEYLVIVRGYEQRVNFFASSREEADEKAADWVGENGSVIEFLGKWKVQ